MCVFMFRLGYSNKFWINNCSACLKYAGTFTLSSIFVRFIENVTSEINRLESNSSEAIQAVNESFDALQSLISERKQAILSNIDNICSLKKKAFREQQQLIEAEEVKVERDCEGELPLLCWEDNS